MNFVKKIKLALVTLELFIMLASLVLIYTGIYKEEWTLVIFGVIIWLICIKDWFEFGRVVEMSMKTLEANVNRNENIYSALSASTTVRADYIMSMDQAQFTTVQQNRRSAFSPDPIFLSREIEGSSLESRMAEYMSSLHELRKNQEQQEMEAQQEMERLKEGHKNSFRNSIEDVEI